MIRTILTVITAVLSTLFFGLIALITGLFHPYSWIVDGCARYWAKSILFFTGVNMEIDGLEHIDTKKNYIIMANHQSQFDILALYSIIPLTARFIAKKELFKIPLFGWILSTTGMIKIDRADREKAIRSINQALETVKMNRVSVIIFPEGTRSLDGHIQKFKKGGFIMALKSGIPIIPVAISGSRFISKKNSLKISSGNIKILIDKPIMTGSYTYNQREKLINDTYNIIMENYDKEFM